MTPRLQALALRPEESSALLANGTVTITPTKPKKKRVILTAQQRKNYHKRWAKANIEWLREYQRKWYKGNKQRQKRHKNLM
jgi:hypothetical protein